MCPLKVTFLHKFLHGITIRVIKTFFSLKKSQTINMLMRKYLKKKENIPLI